MEFALIRAGNFTMGSPAFEEGRNTDEGPQREVKISQDFYMGKFEVSQGQWETVMGTRPWAGQFAVEENPDHPAVYISWNETQEFIRRLNEAAGESLYRLPTEAEWEYAARAGTTTSWFFGDDASRLDTYAWYREDPRIVSALKTHAVGVKQPNPWGLYDVHGNAAEWTQDFYGPYPAFGQIDPQGPATGSARVIRGGGGQLSIWEVRSASRGVFAPSVRLNTFGLRLVRQIP